MARTRNIKPGFFINEDLAECGLPGQILFAGLWCYADREGRLEDRPRRLKGQIFPLTDGIDVDSILNCLHQQKLIIRYENDNCKYIQIVNFKKHQNPHKNEVASTIPAPDLSVQDTTLADQGSTKHSTKPARSLIHDPSKDPNSNNSEPAQTAEQKSLIDIPVFIEIPLKKKGISYAITYDQLEKWREAYPGLDVEQQLRNLQQWNINNPSKRKTERGIGKHITGWLSREASRRQGSRPSSMSAVDKVIAANTANEGNLEQGSILEGDFEHVD